MSRLKMFTLSLVAISVFSCCYASEQKDSDMARCAKKETTLQASDIKSIITATGSRGEGFQAYLLDGTKVNVFNFNDKPEDSRYESQHWVRAKSDKGEDGWSFKPTRSLVAAADFAVLKKIYETEPSKHASKLWLHGWASFDLHLSLMK